MRQCEVYVHDIRAGLLTEEDNGEYIFAYDSREKTVRLSPGCCILTATMISEYFSRPRRMTPSEPSPSNL